MTHGTPTATAVALAIDVGGTTVKGAVIDADATVRHAERRPTPASAGPDAVITTIVDSAAALADRARGLNLVPQAAGVVVPAVVADGVAVWSANLGLRNVALRELVATRLGLPVVLGHDVRAAALAEARLGAGRTTRRLLFVALGTGIAGGFVLDGRIDDGAHGGAGEIGHIAVRSGPDARPCGCSGRGCLEAYASAAAVARAYARAGGVSLPAHEVAALVAGGDPVAAAVWTEAVDALADGLLVGVALYDPAVLAVGGGLGQAGEVLLAPLRAAMARRRTFHQLPEVVAAELGEEAGIHGAALLALDLAGSRR
jgi:glucokinase